jgi:hypothetical protein
MPWSGIGAQQMENEGHPGGTKLLPVYQGHVFYNWEDECLQHLQMYHTDDIFNKEVQANDSVFPNTSLCHHMWVILHVGVICPTWVFF